MLLASTPAAPRSLHQEVHMGEPNSTSSSERQYQSSTLVQQQQQQQQQQQPTQLPLQDPSSNHNDGYCSVPPPPPTAVASSSSVKDDAADEGLLGQTVKEGDPSESSGRTPLRAAKARGREEADPVPGQEEETQTTEIPKQRLHFITGSSQQVISPAEGDWDSSSSGSTSTSWTNSREEVDRRDCGKKEEGEDKGQGPPSPRRQSPSPSFPLSNSTDNHDMPLHATSTSTTKKASRPLKSALKSSKKGSSQKTTNAVAKGRIYRTRRRVRGLWSDDSNCHFSELHDETLLKVMSYLNMKDLCVTTMVCQRWKYLSLNNGSWKRIDATDFVVHAHAYYTRKEQLPQAKATENTSLALAKRMERYTPHSLSIHSIEHRLSADNFLSSLPGLQELTLSSFAELTDTHIHVLLLSSSCHSKNAGGVLHHAATRRVCVLRKLVLDNCPRLTNATVGSIGKFCPELEELSLAGNANVNDLSALEELWTLCYKPVSPKKKPAPSSPLASLFPTVATPPSAAHPNSKNNAATTTTTSTTPPPTLSQVNSNLSSLFGGPPPPPSTSPPRPSTPPSNRSTLTSLFAPPGQSPVRRHPIATLPRTLSSNGSHNHHNHHHTGQLRRLNISNTSVTAEALVKATKLSMTVNGTGTVDGTTIRLEHLVMKGKTSGGSWNDDLLKELAQVLNVAKIQVLDISCYSSPSSLDDNDDNNDDDDDDTTTEGTTTMTTRTASSTSSMRICRLTDEGIKPFLEQVTNLKELHLSGHSGLIMGTTTLLSSQVLSSLTTLRTLNLEGCKGIFLKGHSGDNNHTDNHLLGEDLKRIDAVANTLQYLTTRGSLRRLNLGYCFSNRSQLENNPDLLAHEECLGRVLIQALKGAMMQSWNANNDNNNNIGECHSVASLVAKKQWKSKLRELDMKYCWFLTWKDVAELRDHCPEIETIHVEGSRAAAAPANNSDTRVE